MQNKKILPALVAVALGGAWPAVRAQAEPADKPVENSSWSDEWFGPGFWRLMGSPYTIHYHSDDDGDHEPIYMIGLERQRMDGWVFGGTYFSNSFGQPSAYVYLGEKVTDFSPWKPFFVQWTANMPGLTRRPGIAPGTPLPDYPEAAMKKSEEGVTSLESCITMDGRLVDVKLARSSGSVTLDSATLAWAQTARYAPAEFNGQAMAVCGYRLDYEWRVAPER